ncbi:MAG: aldehyde dehydrogenase family protein, partial [Haliea sp.]
MATALDTQNSDVSDKTDLPGLASFIDDQWCHPALDRNSFICDANTATPLQKQWCCDEQQIEVALASSQRCDDRGDWENTSPQERAAVLDNIADELSSEKHLRSISFADSITTGVIIRTTRKMAELVPLVFRAAAQYIREGNLEKKLPGPIGEVEYFRKPWGPASLIVPWNCPAAIGSHKIASALAAGAPCIFKPSEWAPHSAIVMTQAITKVGLPAGTFQLTCGNRTIGG